MDLCKIYGLEFDDSIPTGSDRRIMDAAGLVNDYVIGDQFQNGGRNDFDQAYPFGAIRLCNLSLENGRKKITYENEPGFDRTGKNGNVMVQIPRFYSKREKEGTVERWLISGTCHPGFVLEPVFRVGDQELEYVYVGAYNTQSLPGGLFSVTGQMPDVCKTADTYMAEYTQAGYTPYDIATVLCLQKLIAIEFGTRCVKQYLGGIGCMRYFYKINPTIAIQDMGPNRVTVTKQIRGGYFAPGHEIGFGHQEDDPSLHATVVDIRENPKNPDWVDIWYDGPDLRDIIHPHEDSAYGIPQKNGLTDTLPYHTGRTNLQCLEREWNDLTNAFRYRGIENVWGNVWEHTEGIRIQGLHYYYTFDPEQYSLSPDNWHSVSFRAPEQHYLADAAKALWIDSMGMDPQEPLLLLPQHSTGTMDDHGRYYDSTVYAFWDKDYANKPVPTDFIYRFVTGGGYDHFRFGSLFTWRGFITDDTAEWINSSRVCLRR